MPGQTTPELDKRLTEMDRVFRAPPLTQELVAAIKLIAPHFNLTTNEQSRLFWEEDQNGSSRNEFEALTPLFNTMPTPQKVMEIGPGMGRSLVYFCRKLGWDNSELHAYEGDGTVTKYRLMGPRFEDSFCGNLGLLRHILDYNGLQNVTIIDAYQHRLADLPGPYDFLYSFYSIGFHWALDHFLEDILRLLHAKSIAVFTVPPQFTPFPQLQDLSYRIINWKTAWPKDGQLKMLVLSKSQLPIE